jgi:hypothetical protein
MAEKSRTVHSSRKHGGVRLEVLRTWELVVWPAVHGWRPDIPRAMVEDLECRGRSCCPRVEEGVSHQPGRPAGTCALGLVSLGSHRWKE